MLFSANLWKGTCPAVRSRFQLHQTSQVVASALLRLASTIYCIHKSEARRLRVFLLDQCLRDRDKIIKCALAISRIPPLRHSAPDHYHLLERNRRRPHLSHPKQIVVIE